MYCIRRLAADRCSAVSGAPCQHPEQAERTLLAGFKESWLSVAGPSNHLIAFHWAEPGHTVSPEPIGNKQSKPNKPNLAFLQQQGSKGDRIVDTYAKLRALKEEERQKWMLPRFKTASNLGKRHIGGQN